LTAVPRFIKVPARKQLVTTKYRKEEPMRKWFDTSDRSNQIGPFVVSVIVSVVVGILAILGLL